MSCTRMSSDGGRCRFVHRTAQSATIHRAMSSFLKKKIPRGEPRDFLQYVMAQRRHDGLSAYSWQLSKALLNRRSAFAATPKVALSTDRPKAEAVALMAKLLGAV